MNNTIIKFLRINNVKRILKQVFYQLGLNFWQYVSGATDLGIHFRKFECDNSDNGYSMMCTNEGTVNEKRSSRRGKLAYKLEWRRSGLLGLGWASRIWPGLAFDDWARLLLSHALGRRLVRLTLGNALGASSKRAARRTWADRRREGEGEGKKKEKREKWEWKRERKKRRRIWRIWFFGF